MSPKVVGTTHPAGCVRFPWVTPGPLHGHRDPGAAQRPRHASRQPRTRRRPSGRSKPATHECRVSGPHLGPGVSLVSSALVAHLPWGLTSMSRFIRLFLLSSITPILTPPRLVSDALGPHAHPNPHRPVSRGDPRPDVLSGVGPTDLVPPGPPHLCLHRSGPAHAARNLQGHLRGASDGV